jgi:hypothetical protein
MATEQEQKHQWIWGILILLVLWWWWRRRKTHETWLAGQAAASAASATANSDAAQVAGTGSHTSDSAEDHPAAAGASIGGGGTMQGYARGDTSDESLAHVAPETIAFLNATNFMHPSQGDMGVGLYDAYVNQLHWGTDTSAVKAQIAARIAGGAP